MSSRASKRSLHSVLAHQGPDCSDGNEDDDYEASASGSEDDEGAGQDDSDYGEDGEEDVSDDEYKPAKKTKTASGRAAAAPQAAALPVPAKTWLGVTDASELHRLLEDQHLQIVKLQGELTQTKMLLASSKRAGPAGAADAKAPAPAAGAAAGKTLSPEACAANARKYLAQLSKQIKSQMAYKPSLKRGGRAMISAMIPNLSMPELEAVLGEHAKQGTNGPKQLQVTVSPEALPKMGLDGLSKSLRYGAWLEIAGNGLKMTYEKASGTLKVSGHYTMSK